MHSKSLILRLHLQKKKKKDGIRNPKDDHKLQIHPTLTLLIQPFQADFDGDFPAFDGDFGSFVALSVFFGNRTGLIFGRTPPLAIVTPASNFPSSSSFLIANRTCLGMILFFLLSLAAFPANSRTYKADPQKMNTMAIRKREMKKKRKMTIRLPQRLGTPSLRLSRPERRCRHAVRIFRSSDNERYGRRGTVNRLWRSEKLPSSSRLLFFLLRLSLPCRRFPLDTGWMYCCGENVGVARRRVVGVDWGRSRFECDRPWEL